MHKQMRVLPKVGEILSDCRAHAHLLSRCDKQPARTPRPHNDPMWLRSKLAALGSGGLLKQDFQDL